MSEKNVIIYTDGACSGNPGPGGYGVILCYQKQQKQLSQGFRLTTNNRMEITAVIKALEYLKKSCVVDLYTDSTYVKNAFDKNWLNNWQNNGWKSKGRKPISNKDLWVRLLEVSRNHEITWHWVKGHSNNPENNRCDELAVQARKFLKNN